MNGEMNNLGTYMLLGLLVLIIFSYLSKKDKFMGDLLQEHFDVEGNDSLELYSDFIPESNSEHFYGEELEEDEMEGFGDEDEYAQYVEEFGDEYPEEYLEEFDDEEVMEEFDDEEMVEEFDDEEMVEEFDDEEMVEEFDDEEVIEEFDEEEAELEGFSGNVEQMYGEVY